MSEDTTTPTPPATAASTTRKAPARRRAAAPKPADSDGAALNPKRDDPNQAVPRIWPD